MLKVITFIIVLFFAYVLVTWRDHRKRKRKEKQTSSTGLSSTGYEDTPSVRDLMN
jgi:hypothetical protein